MDVFDKFSDKEFIDEYVEANEADEEKEPMDL